MARIRTPYKRKILFIKRGFQTRFILKFCLIVLFSSLMLGNFLYWSGPDSTTIVFHNLRIHSIPTRQFLFPSITTGIIFSLFTASILTILLTLVASHRIGGPLFRFEQVLKKLAQGDLSQDVYLRDYDQCREIGENLNTSLRALQDKIKSLEKNIQELEKILPAEDPKTKHALDGVKEALRQFKY